LGELVPIPTFPDPVIVIRVAGALSAVPLLPAPDVLKLMLELPLPVDVPELRLNSPPFLSVAPEVAPPADTLRLLPAVFAVPFLSPPMVRAEAPPKPKSTVGADVPIPIFPLV